MRMESEFYRYARFKLAQCQVALGKMGLRLYEKQFPDVVDLDAEELCIRMAADLARLSHEIESAHKDSEFQSIILRVEAAIDKLPNDELSSD